MRVIQVINTLAPGGAEQSTVALLPHLQERGVELEMVLLRPKPGLHDRVRGFGVSIHQLDPARGRHGWVRQLRTVLAAQRPDLVHTCLFEADVCGRVAAASLGIPVVSTLPSELYGHVHLDQAGLSRPKVWASQMLDGSTARLTRRLHAVSNQVADTMSARLRYPRGRIDVVFRGRPGQLVDGPPGWDGGDALRRSLGLSDHQRVLLVMARHERAKGVDRALEAMPGVLAAVPDTVLLVAGRTGEHTPDLEAAIDRLGLDRSVRLLGYRDDVAGLLRISDAFVLVSRREGLPGALIEAMAAGTPAVVNHLPQVLEVVGEREAVVVDARVGPAVVAGIVEVLTDPISARRRADAARRRFLDHFTLDRVADSMREFYLRSLD